MIRLNVVGNAVMDVYRIIPEIRFPLHVPSIIGLYNNCRYQSYKRFAEINHCSYYDVINLLESKSGNTQFDKRNGRYLIICNESENPFRWRWTCAHELGHVLCGHFLDYSNESDLENSTILSGNNDYEKEADLFAASLLSPIPLFDILEIRKPDDLVEMFGISIHASQIRWTEYKRLRNETKDLSSFHEIRSLFNKKRPLDEILFDVPHHAVSFPEPLNPIYYHTSNSYFDH